MAPDINPWSSEQSPDLERLFKEFGIEPIGDVIDLLPEVPYFMRRGIVIGHRDYRQIALSIRNKTPFHVLTGFMPSGHPHLGHLMVMKEVVWHVSQGGNGYIAIADKEAHAVRDTPWTLCETYGMEYLRVLFALGYSGKTYFQSKNRPLGDLAFEASCRVNFSELQAIYGFGPDTSLAHPVSVITQVADILYPQVDLFPAPTIVPVGLDQDPHLRLTRGMAHKMRMFTVEDRGDHISVRSKDAPSEAIDAVFKAFPGSKRYEGHVDLKGTGCAEASARVRDIERANGGFGFFTPSSSYHRFIPGLQGGKMSSSIPDSTIGFFEPEASVRKKLMSAFTGGRPTLAEQRALGGEPERCPLFLLNLFHMAEDDAVLEEIRRKCTDGEITCGQCKKDTVERVLEYLARFRERMDETAHKAEEAAKWI